MALLFFKQYALSQREEIMIRVELDYNYDK